MRSVLRWRLLGEVGLGDADQLDDLLLGAVGGDGLVADHADDEAAVGQLDDAHRADAGVRLHVADKAVPGALGGEGGLDLEGLRRRQQDVQQMLDILLTPPASAGCPTSAETRPR